MVSKIFNGLWKFDKEQSARSVHSYYQRKNGDRKVVVSYRLYQPVDRLWLQSGSGKYFIRDHGIFGGENMNEVVDIKKDPSRALDPNAKPPIPPLFRPR